MLAGGMPGQGGITRGRADAALQLTNATEGDTNFAAKKLPPGRAIPREWHLTGLMRASPKADPVRVNTRRW